MSGIWTAVHAKGDKANFWCTEGIAMLLIVGLMRLFRQVGECDLRIFVLVHDIIAYGICSHNFFKLKLIFVIYDYKKYQVICIKLQTTNVKLTLGPKIKGLKEESMIIGLII